MNKVDLSGEKNIPTHVVAVFGFIQKGDKYLIAKRSTTDPQAGGEWSIPSGKVEIEGGNYLLEKTLKREILEEVGVEVEDNFNYLVNGAFTRVSGHHVIAITFICKWKSGEAEPLEDQEEVRWMTIEQLVNFNELPPYTRERVQFLNDYLTNSKNR